MTITSQPLKRPEQQPDKPKPGDGAPSGGFTFGGVKPPFYERWNWGRIILAVVTALVLAAVGFSITIASLSRSGHLPEWASWVPEGLRPPMLTADLSRTAFTTLPAGWRDRDTARRDHLTAWCKRADTPACPVEPDAVQAMLNNPAFRAHFAQERSAGIKAMAKTGPKPRDLRGADLSFSQMTGADLRRAQLDGAWMVGAVLEEADLRGARFGYTDLSEANLVGATLIPKIETTARINLRRADLRGAVLSSNPDESQEIFGDFRAANFDGARLEGRFTGRFGNASETFFSMRGADVSGAYIENALMWLPYQSKAMDGLIVARAQEAFTELLGGPVSPMLLAQIANDTPTVTFKGTALAGLDLRNLAPVTGKEPIDDLIYARIFRNSFGDAHVRLPKGVMRPCHWLSDPGLTLMGNDEAFLGAWRAWLVRGGVSEWPPNGLDPMDTSKRGSTFTSFLKDIEARDDLLPPAEICTWESCDCSAVEAWRSEE
ncbi:pentapeptide repeat-containing protein [Pacificoceanicola onchidii]|uniref:pentapeptide repeat-containing protein n=1 Tax=Pacificoceanicola onchidii TaxID=2562685 RepID=UPI0019808924|nr:pentapeptide repeat-containing protein [Pacificoceanicola onchidii]